MMMTFLILLSQSHFFWFFKAIKTIFFSCAALSDRNSFLLPYEDEAANESLVCEKESNKKERKKHCCSKKRCAKEGKGKF